MKRLIPLVCAMSLLPQLARSSTLFGLTDLVTDATDADLVNPWGISYPPTGPFWVSDNGTGKSTLYSVDPATNATTKNGLVVAIPGVGNVTGQAFNPTAGSGQFNRDNFLFVSEDGTISGWRGALGTTAEVLQLASSDNVYKGSALATISGNSYLYSANFRAGTIDILKGDAGAPNLSGSFLDPNLPSGYAPFNVANLGGVLYVSYAVKDPLNPNDEASALGNGIVDRYDLQGNLLKRVATGGSLDSPWGLAIAPASFGTFAGDLLVGNFGDGKINAFDLSGDSFAGQLADAQGDPLAIDGLWGLIPGNGGNAGNSESIYFTAGPGNEAHGRFGVLNAVPEPAAGVLVGMGLAALAVAKGWRAETAQLPA